MSSHIISDLERICDTIGYLHEGRMVFYQEKDALLERLGVLHCGEGDLACWNRSSCCGCAATIRMRRFGGLPRVNSESPPRLGRSTAQRSRKLCCFMQRGKNGEGAAPEGSLYHAQLFAHLGGDVRFLYRAWLCEPHQQLFRGVCGGALASS